MRYLRCFLFVSVLIIGSPALQAEGDADLAAKVNRAVARLDAPDFKTREKATEELADLLPGARDLLEKALAGTAPALSDEQRDRIRSLLKNGKSSIWERRSGLVSTDTDLLRQLRAKKVERQRSYEQLNRVEQMFSSLDLNDEGLALIVVSLCAQISDDEKNNEGFEPWQLSQLFNRAIDNPKAGKATAEAFQQWVDDWMLPGIRMSREQRNFGSHQQDMQIFCRLLVSGTLPGEVFKRVWAELLPRLQTSTHQSYGDYSSVQAMVLGLAVSPFTSTDDLGDLVTNVLYLSDSSSGMGMSYGYEPGVLRYLIATARLSDTQARTLGDWLVAQYQAARPMWNLDELMRLLTGASVAQPGDRDLFKQRTMEAQKVMGDRWRQWWSTNRDKLSRSAVIGPKHRFISVTLQRKHEQITVTLDTDIEIAERQARLIQHPDQFDADWVLVQGAEALDLAAIQKVIPDDGRPRLILETVDMGGTRMRFTNGGRSVTEGDADFSAGGGWAQVQQLRRSAEEAEPAHQMEFHMLLAPDDKLGKEKLTSLDFWEERLVDTAVRAEKWAEKLSAIPEDKRPNVNLGTQQTLDALDHCRTVGIEKRLAALQKDDSPRVASAAAALIARWGLKPDHDRLVKLLASADETVSDRAASALTFDGSMEGIALQVDRASKEGPAGKSYSSLLRFAGQNRLTVDQRTQGAVLVIQRLLPREEKPDRSAVAELILARRWTNLDYGYRVGAPAADNTRVLQKYHDWAAHPSPVTRPGSDEDESARRRRAR